jgi:5,10-methenyltetrahydromethanopterin hydrogenase
MLSFSIREAFMKVSGGPAGFFAMMAVEDLEKRVDKLEAAIEELRGRLQKLEAPPKDTSLG